MVTKDILSRMQRGFFVAIEGPDGAGKTTFAKALAESLENNPAIEVALLSEPSRSDAGNVVRSIMSGNLPRPSNKEVAALFALDRIEHACTEIMPLLMDGKLVICDRYIHSSLAYQGAVDGVPEETILAMNRYAPRPDVVLILMADKETCLERIAQRGKPVDIYEEVMDFIRVHRHYYNWECAANEYKLDGSMATDALVGIALTIIENAHFRFLMETKLR